MGLRLVIELLGIVGTHVYAVLVFEIYYVGRIYSINITHFVIRLSVLFAARHSFIQLTPHSDFLSGANNMYS